MNEDVFRELLESIREGGAILRGEVQPTRSFAAADPDVTELRESYGLSQAQFATLLGISVRTLQNWEQKRRTPEGPARVLLRVAAHFPEAIFAVVHEEQRVNAAASPQRLGFPVGEILVPDDFDRMGEAEIAAQFGADAE